MHFGQYSPPTMDMPYHAPVQIYQSPSVIENGQVLEGRVEVGPNPFWQPQAAPMPDQDMPMPYYDMPQQQYVSEYFASSFGPGLEGRL